MNITKIFFQLTLCSALCALPKVAICATPAHLGGDIKFTLLNDMRARQNSSFSDLLVKWEGDYGTRAAQPLFEIGKDVRQDDSSRYIGILGAARLGGKPTAPALVPMLKDRSWMIRVATLRALTVLGDGKTSCALLPLLNDPALVVRNEAVLAVENLRPPGSSQALVATLKDPKNFVRGKALWVPMRSLQALRNLNDPEVVPGLISVYHAKQDVKFRLDLIQTIEKLSGRTTPAQADLSERIEMLRQRP